MFLGFLFGFLEGSRASGPRKRWNFSSFWRLKLEGLGTAPGLIGGYKA